MKPLVVKIGGSTLSSVDTTLEDLVHLQKRAVRIVVVHGGGNTVTEWLTRLGIQTRFVHGLRVTDRESLDVVIAVLAGLVNKELVASIQRSGGKAIGLSGADANLIQAENITPELGYTGEKLTVDISIVNDLLDRGYLPVISPISLASLHMQNDVGILNVNGDTAAAKIAAALPADKLIFLTDVPGLLAASNSVIPSLRAGDIDQMIKSGTAKGGMATKVSACLDALVSVQMTRIIDGRLPHALLNEYDGKEGGTTIVQ